MNFFALLIGLVTVSYVIIKFKKTRLEKTRWAYPLLLASFPFYYFVFAIYADDTDVLKYEIVIGLIYFTIALIAFKSNLIIASLLLGVGCLTHGMYDIFHNYLFINPGTPTWWAEFCGAIDLILGIYLIYFTLSLTKKIVTLKKSV